MLALLTLYRSEHWLRFRNFVFGMFGAWIALFFLTSMKPLNKLIVPGIDLPLGSYLPMQAAVIVFAVMVYRFARAPRELGGPDTHRWT